MEYNSLVVIPMVATNFITQGHSGSSHLLQTHYSHNIATCINVMGSCLNYEVFPPFGASFKTQLDLYLLYESLPNYSFSQGLLTNQSVFMDFPSLKLL